MTRIYAAESIIDAQLLCDRLIDNGIDAIVKGAYLTGAVGEIPADQLVSVWIFDEDLQAAAKQIVRDFERERNKPPEEVICGNCREVNQGNFGFCWSCGKAL
ncbi:MAG: DUF2007 domain-containing protein [Gammaproteobacteria bacterium]|nr:DUF2007 domain-containing protein [Gammaproteobacteria bacterium]